MIVRKKIWTLSRLNGLRETGYNICLRITLQAEPFLTTQYALYLSAKNEKKEALLAGCIRMSDSAFDQSKRNFSVLYIARV